MKQSKTPKSIDEFPPDVSNFIHELCVNAILRAIANGTYKNDLNENGQNVIEHNNATLA